MEKLPTCSFESINGLCNGIGPIGKLESSKWSLFCLFWVKKRFPKIGTPLRVLGVPLAQLSLLSMPRYTTNVVLRCTIR